MQTTQIVAFSHERYNGGIAVKRKYGSATVTVFIVHRKGEERLPEKWQKIEGRGATPSIRKAAAIAAYRPSA